MKIYKITEASKYIGVSILMVTFGLIAASGVVLIMIGLIYLGDDLANRYFR